MNAVIVRVAGRLILRWAIAAIATAAAAANVVPRYFATPVAPTPVGAQYLDPADINDAGHIVGLAALAANTRGFFTDSAMTTILPPLADGDYTYATALNNLDQIVGSSDVGFIPNAAFWASPSASAEELPTGGDPDANVYATGINESTQISGFFTGSGSGNVKSWTALRWTRDVSDPTRFRETKLVSPTVPPPGVPTMANDINESGYIVGLGPTLQADVFQAALRWTPADVVEELLATQGAFFPRFEATAINDQQVGVGTLTDTFGHSTPIRWDAAGAPTPLGLAPGDASTIPTDINNAGVIVGTGGRETGSRAVANFGGGWFDLKARLIDGAGWELRTATAINDGGMIVGMGSFKGAPTGFVLTPARPMRLGDFDFDGGVDGDDMLVWQRENGATASGAADANDDGQVDAADLAIWQENFGLSAPAAADSATPEPAGAVLAAGALAALAMGAPAWRSPMTDR